MQNAFDTKYTVLDDLKGIINDEFLQPLDDKQKAHFEMIYGQNPTPQNLLRELEPFEKCTRCLKSVRNSMMQNPKKHKCSHFFKATPRG